MGRSEGFASFLYAQKELRGGWPACERRCAENGMLRLLSVNGVLNEERCVKIGRCRRSQEEKPSFDGEDRNVRINRLLSYTGPE